MKSPDGALELKSKRIIDILKEKVAKEAKDEQERFFLGILGPKFDELIAKVNNAINTLTGKGKEIITDEELVYSETNLVKKDEVTKAQEAKKDIVLGDLTHLRSKYSKQAWSRCNNPAGISWNEEFENPSEGSLAYELQQAGIKFSRAPGGRGSGENGSYVAFDTMDDGLKAMVLLWEISAKNGVTIERRLSTYATSPYKLDGVDASRKFNELTPEQKNDLLMKQVKQESGGLYKELNNRDIDFQKLDLI